MIFMLFSIMWGHIQNIPLISNILFMKHDRELAVELFLNYIKSKRRRKSWNLSRCHDIICGGCDKKLSRFRASLSCTMLTTHYWRRALCRVPVALGKGSFALGKAFAECNTRQRASVESPSGKGYFAECQISGTRQRFDAVGRRPTPSIFLKKLFAECHSSGTRQRNLF